MQNYRIIQRLGEGTFGTCFKAMDNRSGQLVALKKIKKEEEEHRCPEITVLRKLDHINIIKLIEVIPQQKEMMLVLEYAERTLLTTYQQVQQQGRQFNEQQIKSIVYQLASALLYLHQQGYFHRDLKPENVMISENGVIKLIDFGQIKRIDRNNDHTDYVSTRWYRAPEQLVSTLYGPEIDVWALGCIMAELFLLKPLVAGTSEIDQLYRIEQMFGPLAEMWPQGQQMLESKGAYVPTFLSKEQSGTNRIVKNDIASIAGKQPKDLLLKMLKVNPQLRISPQDILEHPWLSNKHSFLPMCLVESDNTDKYMIEQSPLQSEKSFVAVHETIKRPPVTMMIPNTPPRKHNKKHDEDPLPCDYIPSQLAKRTNRRQMDYSPPQETPLPPIPVQEIHQFHTRVPSIPPSKVNLKIPTIVRERPWQHSLTPMDLPQEPAKLTFFSKPLMRQKQ